VDSTRRYYLDTGMGEPLVALSTPDEYIEEGDIVYYADYFYKVSAVDDQMDDSGNEVTIIYSHPLESKELIDWQDDDLQEF